MSRPTRLIVFLELVHGCNNKECPSWGGVCSYEDAHFMTPEVLEKTAEDVRQVLSKPHPFEVIDLWLYGCGDSLDHPDLVTMLSLARQKLGGLGKLSLATDSHRAVPAGNWWTYLDKVKVIHKQPENFDWQTAAIRWANECKAPMSHKLIPKEGGISKAMWDVWQQHLQNNGPITELKAVPWHEVGLGTDTPKFTRRRQLVIEEGVPWREEPYPGRPVRRALVKWDGSLRRCLVAPTEARTMHDLILGEDRICYTCFPLTGGNLAKFYPDRVALTPSAACVSDGYMDLTRP